MLHRASITRRKAYRSLVLKEQTTGTPFAHRANHPKASTAMPLLPMGSLAANLYLHKAYNVPWENDGQGDC